MFGEAPIRTSARFSALETMRSTVMCPTFSIEAR